MLVHNTKKMRMFNNSPSWGNTKMENENNKHNKKIKNRKIKNNKLKMRK